MLSQLELLCPLCFHQFLTQTLDVIQCSGITDSEPVADRYTKYSWYIFPFLTINVSFCENICLITVLSSVLYIIIYIIIIRDRRVYINLS